MFRSRSAFTLIELLISIGILIILIGMVFTVGQSVIEGGKGKQTRAMIAQVMEAAETFRDENPYRSSGEAQQRYGAYPPDDLMAYTEGAGHGKGSDYDDMPNLMPGGLGTYVAVSLPGLDSLTDDYTDDQSYIANGDIKALCWALGTLDKSRVIFDAIPDKFKKSVPLQQEFFDMNGSGGNAEPLIDKQVQCLVDSWGQPLSYYAAQDLAEADLGGDPTPHGGAAQMLTRANNGRALIVSYGPDGAQQVEAGETFEADYENTDFDEKPFARPSHQDNVYSDDSIADRIAELVKLAL